MNKIPKKKLVVQKLTQRLQLLILASLAQFLCACTRFNLIDVEWRLQIVLHLFIY